MKDYKEVADIVFERSKEIIADNNRRKRKIIKLGSLMTCFGAAVLICFGVFHSGMDKQIVIAEQFAEGHGNSGESDVVYDIFDADTNENFTESSVTVSEENSSYSQGESFNGSGIGNGVMIPDVDGNSELPKFRTMISSYEKNSSASACYAAPENGTFYFSMPLNGALDEYGDSDDAGEIIYRVAVHIFKDKQMLDPDSEAVKEEADRLFECGYTVAVEKYYDGSGKQCYFTLHAEKKQLTDFAAAEEYGYMFYLYDELVL